MAERPSESAPRLVKFSRRPILGVYLKQISGFVGVTSHTVTIYRQKYDYHGPTAVCPYHRNLSEFQIIKKRADTPHELTALVLGSLIPRKRVQDAIRAISSVSDPVRLLIAGDGPERRRLENLAAHVGRNRVEFLGEIPFQKVPELFARVHVLVCPSQNDGFGMAVVEALAAGVPVVASDGTMSALEYIQQGVNGWVISVGDVDGYAQVISSIVANPEVWPGLSLAARESLQGHDRFQDAHRLRAFLADLARSKTESSGL
jgi:glycosyltransferase involved in cell wall biosynthesis